MFLMFMKVNIYENSISSGLSSENIINLLKKYFGFPTYSSFVFSEEKIQNEPIFFIRFYETDLFLFVLISLKIVIDNAKLKVV